MTAVAQRGKRAKRLSPHPSGPSLLRSSTSTSSRVTLVTSMMSDLSELSELSEDEELPEDAGSTEPVGSGADDDDDAVLSDNMDATVGGTESGLRGNIPSLRRTQRVPVNGQTRRLMVKVMESRILRWQTVAVRLRHKWMARKPAIHQWWPTHSLLQNLRRLKRLLES